MSNFGKIGEVWGEGNFLTLTKTLCVTKKEIQHNRVFAEYQLYLKAACYLKGWGEVRVAHPLHPSSLIRP